ncbi:MAG: hypothetical protein ACRYGM_02650 [Janthinobacterium lividum]
MNNDIKLSKLMGSISLILGAGQLMAAERINEKLALGIPTWVVRLFGAREVVSGFVVLAHPDEAAPIGLRLAGDALDLAMLGKALLPGRTVTNTALLAAVFALGVTALDLSAGVTLRRRRGKVLATARRTRLTPAPSARG